MNDRKIQICVVDDDEPVRTMLCEKLDEAGFATFKAANGLEGMAVLERSDIAVMVVDIVMPEQEGIQTIMQIKATRPRVRILAISGGARGSRHDYLAMAKDLGADEVMAKPFRGDQFVACVKRRTALGKSSE